MQNVVHAISILETSPEARKIYSYVDLVENYAIFLSS